MQAKQITGTKREGSEVDETVTKPPKRAPKELSTDFTKAVIICNESELSKSDEKTYRPNNIVVEILKKNPMRYGKVVFPKCASEDEIKEELCLRFPVLKNKRLSFSSADQYGKLNFRESEKWTGRNVRRWLPGSSAMYVIFEGDEDINDERPTKNKEQCPTISYRTPSSGLSYTTMRKSPEETNLLWKSNRSQRALLDILSSPDKIKIDETQRPKIFDMGSMSKLRTLPRSHSMPTFSGSSIEKVVKKEKIEVDLELHNNCRYFDNLESRQRIPKLKQSTSTSDSPRPLNECEDLVASRLDAVKQSHQSSKNHLHPHYATQVRSRDTNSMTSAVLQSKGLLIRKLDGTSNEYNKVTVKRSLDYADSSLTTIKKRCEEMAQLREETNRKMTFSNIFTTNDRNHNSLPARSGFPVKKVDASVTQRQNLSQEPEHDDNQDWINGKKANQTSIKNSSESNRKFSDNRETDDYDIRPYLVPCYMIPNPLHAGPLYRSMTSYSPAFCVPTNGAFPWKQERDYGPMMLKGNMIGPLPFKAPRREMVPYCFDDSDVRGSLMDTDESPLQQQSQDTLEEYEIIPSKGTCKGGDTFVILFKKPLDHKVLVIFGETEAHDVTQHSPYTLKGVTPESTDIGPVAVTLSTKDGQTIGTVSFTYIEDFIDKISKTVCLVKKQNVTPHTSTCSETENSTRGETSNNKVLPENLLESKIEEPSESASSDHVTREDVREGQCCSERVDAPHFDDPVADDNVTITGRVYEERIPFIPDGLLKEQTKEEGATADESQSTTGLIETNNGLLLLSSIASKMKDDTTTNRRQNSSKSSPNNSKKTRKSETKKESNSGFYKKVFILPANSLYLPSQSDLCKLRMSGDCYSKVFFHVAMTGDDVMVQIRKMFPDLKGLRLRLASVDQTGKLVFHDQVWTGKLIRKKLRGNSVLYVAPVD